MNPKHQIKHFTTSIKAISHAIAKRPQATSGGLRHLATKHAATKNPPGRIVQCGNVRSKRVRKQRIATVVITENAVAMLN